MSDIVIRPDPACSDNGLFGWDSVYNETTGCADWSLSGPQDAPSNLGGLQNIAALSTFVVIALFTDQACPPGHPLEQYADGDPRGWWGDGLLEDGEVAMGSLLWLLERSVATETTRRYAEVFALAALQPLLDASAAADIAASASILPQGNGIFLDIALYGQDGSKIYDRRFEMSWRQAAPAAIGSPRG
ncbi:phage GP46 family protein [Methylocella tundrae]|uniref:Mu-like prophage protein gp46 n=1 Tax=Methylocella tundrae TaxID=227605 RepID=A0A4V6IMF2_METTU|nr:phage GP46 family protein [Methylocella tundrae]WPP05517.1 phage GP46 family protein [Methylocella tundrae]VFU07943.1 Mu-like prophage protein gp46 [Methylocella tundrae]